MDVWRMNVGIEGRGLTDQVASLGCVFGDVDGSGGVDDGDFDVGKTGGGSEPADTPVVLFGMSEPWRVERAMGGMGREYASRIRKCSTGRVGREMSSRTNRPDHLETRNKCIQK